MRKISSDCPFTRYSTMKGVFGMTSSLVPATRPVRPNSGLLRKTASVTRTELLRPAILASFFSRCLIAVLTLTVNFADSVLLISIRFYCTILADSRHGRRNSMIIIFLFPKAAASNEMHPLKMRPLDRLASMCACVAKRDRLAQVVNQMNYRAAS
jgi:hypothetical protein